MESEILSSEDLKHRSSVFSFPPFFTFTSVSLLFFTINSGLLPHHHPSPQQAGLSAVLHEICPEALRWAAKYRGWIAVGTKDPPQKSTMKGLDLGKNVFNSPSIDGRCMYGMCTRGQRVKIPRLGSRIYIFFSIWAGGIIGAVLLILSLEL